MYTAIIEAIMQLFRTTVYNHQYQCSFVNYSYLECMMCLPTVKLTNSVRQDKFSP